MKRENWTSYSEVFNTIVSAVHSDYAGYEERKAWDMPRLGVRVTLYNSRYFHGDDDKFLRYVRYYLRVLGDPSLTLRKGHPDYLRDWTVGFTVRAQEEALYVTSATEETRFGVGDRIVRIDGMTLAEYRTGIRQRVLYGSVPERELWDYYLQYAAELTLVRAGSEAEETLMPGHYEKTIVRQEAARFLSEAPGVCRLQLLDLSEADAVYEVVSEHEAEITAARVLLLDLRSCQGGDFEALLPFLTFLIDEPVIAAELFPEKGLYMRYSAKNRLRIPELAAAPKERKGLFWEEHEYLKELAVELAPAGGPERIYILTDLYCQDEAERLVQLAAALPKVTVIGRPTLGTADYQEKVTVSFEEDLFFTYPAGKTKAAMEGNGIFGTGVAVDEYIPWTPAECDRDVILERALALAEK